MRMTPDREKEIREAATNYWPCEECAGTLTEGEAKELFAEIDALRTILQHEFLVACRFEKALKDISELKGSGMAIVIDIVEKALKCD